MSFKSICVDRLICPKCEVKVTQEWEIKWVLKGNDCELNKRPDKECDSCKVSLVVQENAQEPHTTPSRVFNFIAPLMPYTEFGMKGGPKEIYSKRQIKEYCKREAKVCASDNEISQEADKNSRYLDRQADIKLESNIKDRVAHLDAKGWG